MTVRLIVVDDHAIVRRGIVQVLAEHPDVQIVAEAHDYASLRLELKKHGEPDVLVMELHMPKLDGLEVLAAIRADEHLRTIPVVVLTSSREQRDVIRSYDLGVNAFVVKPVNFSELITAVKEIGLFWAIINEPPPGSAR